MRRETRYVSEAACPTSSRNDEEWRLRLPGLGDAVRTGDEERRRRRPAESVRARSAPASSTEARIANAKQSPPPPPPPRPAAQRSGEIRIGFWPGRGCRACVQGSSDGAGKRAAGGRIDGGVLVSRDS